MPKKKKSGKSKGGKEELPTSAIVYRGPVQVRKGKEDADLVTTVLNYTTFVYSDSSGKFVYVWGNAPVNGQDWASLAASYAEYRTLAMKLDYFPANRYSKITTACTPIGVVVDRASATVLSTYLAAVGSSSFRMESLEDPWSRTVHMSGVEEAEFLSTSAATDLVWIKTYGELNATTSLYGLVVVTYRVQFRGRK
jgi:hypothetical protein